MRNLFIPRAIRAREATPDQLVATGAYGAYGVDPVDGDRGYTQLGQSPRDVPVWTLRKARAFSLAAYRSNPLARAIVDTYVAFCVGDSGVGIEVDSDLVRPIIDDWWGDPRNRIGAIQERLFRSHMLMGETVIEHLVGSLTGVVRHSVIDPERVTNVTLRDGNPLWLAQVTVDQSTHLDVVEVDDLTGLRVGNVSFFAGWQALITDRRGTPFLLAALDSLDNYDTVASNLIDRTALARYLVWDVEVEGSQTDVDEFVAARKGTHVPRSGTIEVHNQAVKWKPQTVDVGSFEDTNTLTSIMTQLSAGAGLSKHWLSDPEGANRATSMTMAEPVRRRVGSVQNEWLSNMTDVARFVVDRAVAARRIPAYVDATDSSGQRRQVAAAQTVRVTGPAIAAADAQITATVLMNLGTALEGLVQSGALSKAAAQIAAQKAWEQFVGTPFRADLMSDVDAAATDIQSATEARLRAV
jgi:hypothetical protein